MEHYDYLIIGGGIAGVSAAEVIRKTDPAASIAIAADESHPLYSRVLLPNFVKGHIRREQVFLRRSEFYQEQRISFFGGEQAEALGTEARKVIFAGGQERTFGKLLLAGGGRPIAADMPGSELPGVSRFQTIADADRMIEFLGSATRAVVVGGGFIALEYLGILAERHIPATLILRDPHVFAGILDEQGARLMQKNFLAHGVAEIVAGDPLVAIAGEDHVRNVQTASGRTFACDFLGIGIGLKKNTAWLESSKLALTPRGVQVNEFLESGVTGIFAAGDIADFLDPLSGLQQNRGNWTNAFLQGRTAGANMVASSPQPFLQVSSYSTHNLGFAVTFVGEPRESTDVRTVVRMDEAAKMYERFFFRGDRLIGAALLNRHQDQTPLATLIRSGALIPDAEQRLSDMTLDLVSLIQ